MNRTKIDWPELDYTWNPVVGCKTGCEYCYAKRMNNRFKWIPDWKEPRLFAERLNQPNKVKKQSRIFVGSMCDLFGPWISDLWIRTILEIVRLTPRHEFMFLTKYPERYKEFSFPDNVWLGTSVEKWDGINGVNVKRLIAMSGHNLNCRNFVSIEPLLGDWGDIYFPNFDLVIVGAMTGPGAIEPKKEWIDSIDHFYIHYKDNIKKYL